MNLGTSAAPRLNKTYDVILKMKGSGLTSMQEIEEILHEIVSRSVAMRRNTSIETCQLAKLSGLLESDINDMESEHKAPTLGFLIRYLRPLGCTLAVVPLHPERDETPVEVEIELPEYLYNFAVAQGIDLNALLEGAIKNALGIP